MIGIQNIKPFNQRVLIRVDFNVPLDKNKKITDITRIQAALPTIQKIITGGGIAVLISHLGRPKTKEKNLSLKPIAKKLSELLNQKVFFSMDCVGNKVLSEIKKLNSGEVILLENLRYYKEEEQGDISFSEKLSKLADIYINDAFGTAHRAHASTSVITRFFKKNCFCGLLLEKEISNLNLILKNPKRPFTAIIGGAKISGKIEIILSLLEKVDKIIIGGGMAYTFIKAMGGNIGKSIVEEDKLILAQKIIEGAKEKNVELILPIDSINSLLFSNEEESSSSDIYKIPEDKMGLDIGKDSILLFEKHILKSKTILWNGPMGVFEFSNFCNGTKSIGKAICVSTLNGAFSLIGGGDSIAASKLFGLSEGVSYTSTGGGAMLEYIEGKELPGIKALS
jgi:phosphoglycerate kinase|tara:strand:- start:202 stop:1386 length:1185 start_codon:yes stop_codon:yes gene_type:complete